jgi:uncharacterized membrane protein (UPF0127 family)
MALMRVRNLSRDADLADHAQLADNFWRRFLGLMGRAGLEPGDGLVIVPCNSVHMLGMRFPLDILHLDKDGTVLRAISDLKPNRLGPLVWRSHVTVELPAGTLAATGTVAGDRVALEPIG